MKPTKEQALEAVKTLIEFAGDDSSREGLLHTPDRVIRAYEEFFSGYNIDPSQILNTTFEETEGYDEIIILKDISFSSHCEHHMVPFIGKASIGYIPSKKVVGISKLARIVDVFARRLQIQEKLTVQIANTINDVLQPKGVAVVIEATHQCMTTRGVNKPSTVMQTSHLMGLFRTDSRTRSEFFSLIS